MYLSLVPIECNLIFLEVGKTSVAHGYYFWTDIEHGIKNGIENRSSLNTLQFVWFCEHTVTCSNCEGLSLLCIKFNEHSQP